MTLVLPRAVRRQKLRRRRGGAPTRIVAPREGIPLTATTAGDVPRVEMPLMAASAAVGMPVAAQSDDAVLLMAASGGAGAAMMLMAASGGGVLRGVVPLMAASVAARWRKRVGRSLPVATRKQLGSWRLRSLQPMPARSMI